MHAWFGDFQKGKRVKGKIKAQDEGLDFEYSTYKKRLGNGSDTWTFQMLKLTKTSEITWPNCSCGKVLVEPIIGTCFTKEILHSSFQSSGKFSSREFKPLASGHQAKHDWYMTGIFLTSNFQTPKSPPFIYVWCKIIVISLPLKTTLCQLSTTYKTKSEFGLKSFKNPATS